MAPTKKDCAELITRQNSSTHTTSIKRKVKTIPFRNGCWNVRSLRNPTKLNIKLLNVIKDMKKNKVQAMTLSEVQWTGCGILEVEEATVLNSGVDEKTTENQRGTTVVLISEIRNAWKEKSLYPINERLMKLRLSGISLVELNCSLCFHGS